MITVTEALSKLKLMEKKIEDAKNRVTVGVVKTNGIATPPAGFKNFDEVKAEVSSRLDSVIGLIEYRDKLKRAIVESNARTMVTIGSQSMTVAAAIEKKTSIKHRRALLTKLVSDSTVLQSTVDKSNSNLDARADQFVNTAFQGVAVSETQRNEARKNWIENNTAKWITADNFQSVVEKLKSDIDEFESNVDIALSVVNAKTEIEI